MKKRALRRYYFFRKRRQVARWAWIWQWWSFYGRQQKEISKLAITPKMCNGRCCCNPRWHDGPTIQERRGPRISDWEDRFDQNESMRRAEEAYWAMYDTGYDMDAIPDGTEEE